MSDPRDKPKDAGEERPDMTRRRIVYVAPAIMSQRMFNAVTGCGKVNPTTGDCSVVPFQS